MKVLNICTLTVGHPTGETEERNLYQLDGKPITRDMYHAYLGSHVVVSSEESHTSVYHKKHIMVRMKVVTRLINEVD